MNKKIKALALGGAIVTLSAAAGMHAVAQERGPGRFAHQAQFQHPMMGDEAPWISISLRHKSELNLTADQVANLEKIRTNFQSQVAPVAQQLSAVEKELRTILQESPANLVLARTKIDQAEKLRADLRYLRVESLENGKTVLSVQQRDQLKNLFTAHPQGMPKPNKGQAS
jgi:Spy/CpxP family protein refolding chaperone